MNRNPLQRGQFHAYGASFTRRDCLRMAALAMAGLGLGGLPACEPDQPLRIAVQPWVGYQLLFLAKQEGWLPLDSLQLLETNNTAESVAAVAAGKADGAALTLDEVLRLRDQGIPLSAVMVFDVSAGADAVLTKPGIRSLADLQGKRIAVESSSLGAIMLAKVIAAGGLKREDLTVEPMGFDHVQTWETGKLDAIITYEPAKSQLLAKGLVNLCDSRDLPQVLLDVLAVRTDAAERHAGALRGLIAGHLRALKRWNSNPIDTAYRLSPRLGVKPEAVNNLFKGLDLPDARYNLEYLAAPADELTRSAQDIAQIMLREGMIKHAPSLDQLFLPDYLPGDGG